MVSPSSRRILAAAFRFGHTMVRAICPSTQTRPAGGASKAVVPLDLGLLGRLPPALVIDWERFFKFDQLEYAREPQNSLQMRWTPPS